ncbi:MAG: HAMP domain-containing protein [Chloroflexi bacterium]|nr:HAMP domain-containing protein [Chloroflexota bacterium]
MRSNLFLKLLGAFALIILIYAAIVLITVGRATTGEFRLYTTRSGQLWAQQLEPILADYYARTGGWEGVEAALQSSMGAMMPHSGMMMGPGMMGEMMGRGMMGGQWDREDGLNMWAMMGQRLILADEQGRVVADTAGEWIGRTLSPQELTAGVPILVDGRRVGTIITASLATPDVTTPAGQFLQSVNRSLLLAGLAASIVALILGAALFFQLTAPIRRLKAAAQAIASGDLSHRVPVRSQDELGELAQAFNTMAESLARAETQRRHLMADIAHELRTPISVIQGNLEAMLDGVLPTNAEQIASLHEETLLLGRLVADLRLLSLAEAGQLKLERGEAKLDRLVRKVAELMQPRAQEKGIRFEIDVSADLPPVFVDPDRIHQVIGNLVSNALRYAPPGGRVTIRAFTEGTPGDPDASVIVQVTDDGPGIAAQDLPHVFDRFYRADRSRTRASGGSGLGLAIVKHLVEAHGGRVWAESPVFTRPDGTRHGTRVSFTLPTVQPSEPPPRKTKGS